MGDDVVRLSVVGALARRRWRLLAACAAIGALIGFGLSFVLSPGFGASSKVLLKGQPDKNQLLTETQIAMSLGVLDKVAGDLQWGVSGIDLQGKVTATVSDGNVLEIVGLASTPERARALTDRAAAEYVTASTQILTDTRQADENAQRQIHDAAQKRVDDLRTQLAAAEGRPVDAPTDAPAPPPADANAASDVIRLTGALNSAQAELAQLDRQATQRDEAPSSGTATILEPALDRGRAAPTPLELAAGGAVVLPLLGLYGLMWAGRRGGRLTDHDQIEAALGAPVLADVTVAGSDLPDGGAPAPSRAGGLARLLADDRAGGPASVDPNGPGETTRYRRALARVGGTVPVPLDLVLVVARDDLAAQAAVVAFATVASVERGTVLLVADDPGAVERYRRMAGGGRRVRVTPAGADDSGETVLRVVEVDPNRPTIPDHAQDRGVLLVTGAGARTSGELVDIAGACVDARSSVTGALLVTVVGSSAPPAPGAGPARSALAARSS